MRGVVATPMPLPQPEPAPPADLAAARLPVSPATELDSYRQLVSSYAYVGSNREFGR